MQFLTDFADAGVVLPVTAAALLAFALLRWWRGALAWAAVLGATLGFVLVLKLGLRACDGWSEPWLPADPSGHVVSATACYGGLAAIALRQYRAALLPALLLAVLVAITRVTLGLHTVADVVAGSLIGVASAAALHRLAGQPPFLTRRLPLVLVLSAALLHGAHLNVEAAITRFAAQLRPSMAACSAHSSRMPSPPSAYGGKQYPSRWNDLEGRFAFFASL